MFSRLHTVHSCMRHVMVAASSQSVPDIALAADMTFLVAGMACISLVYAGFLSPVIDM